jgi:hypothetical protein
MKSIIGMILTVGLLANSSFAYGPRGHAMVGAIADRRLASKPVATTISHLLDGMTLEAAANLPDSIKDWDKHPPGQPNAFRIPAHPQIEAQLIDFWRANKQLVDGQAFHRSFHFSDVPVFGMSNYGSGTIGRPNYDIVHMIAFCAGVLNGDFPANNNRKITKAVAIILLAHYLGDIHQPLHIGAEYFNKSGQTVNPDISPVAFNDEGGNTLALFLDGSTQSVGELHGYWDNQTVETAIELMQTQFKAKHPSHHGPVTDGDLAQELATIQPANLLLNGQVKDLSLGWANEIVPVAREAHERLTFQQIHIVPIHGAPKATGNAIEKLPAAISYEQWSGQVVENELHKGGWRLAALLERCLH